MRICSKSLSEEKTMKLFFIYINNFKMLKRRTYLNCIDLNKIHYLIGKVPVLTHHAVKTFLKDHMSLLIFLKLTKIFAFCCCLFLFLKKKQNNELLNVIKSIRISFIRKYFPLSCYFVKKPKEVLVYNLTIFLNCTKYP